MLVWKDDGIKIVEYLRGGTPQLCTLWKIVVSVIPSTIGKWASQDP